MSDNESNFIWIGINIRKNTKKYLQVLNFKRKGEGWRGGMKKVKGTKAQTSSYKNKQVTGM